MGIAFPRLHRKKSGIYFVRVLFGAVRKFSELRRSLRTKDACHARKIVAALSYFIEGVPMARRQSAFNDFHRSISMWTVGDGGVSVSDDDDQDRFGRFLVELDRHPTWKATFFDILGRTGNVVEAISGCTRPPSQNQEPAITATQVLVAAPNQTRGSRLDRP